MSDMWDVQMRVDFEWYCLERGNKVLVADFLLQCYERAFPNSVLRIWPYEESANIKFWTESFT